MKTLIEQFRERVEQSPDRSAVYHRGRDVSYGQLAGQAQTFATRLHSAGIQKGDRVALLLANSIEFVACYLGILQAGGIVVALNPDTTARELSQTLVDCDPRAIVVDARSEKPLAAVAAQLSNIRVLFWLSDKEISDFPRNWKLVPLTESLGESDVTIENVSDIDDLAQIIYTSGTTGPPKGVTLSHRNISTNCDSILDYLKLSSDDSMLVTLPFFYSYGNSVLFTHLAIGGRLVLVPDVVFWNRNLDLMQQERVTGFAGVPSTFAMLLNKSDFGNRKFPHLRYITCAGGGLAPAVTERLCKLLPETQIFLMYGQTEATARLSTLMPDDVDEKPGSIGRAISGVTLDVLDKHGQPVSAGDIGEIVARGENVMVGYWNDPESTDCVVRPEGLRTGDMARVDENGYLWIEGRRSDMIKSGAHRINPREIEEVLISLEQIAEIAVVGVPDEIWGESPVAFVVKAKIDSDLTPQKIIQFNRSQLPRHKQIREVHFVDSLPRTASGKIKRNELQRNASDSSG